MAASIAIATRGSCGIFGLVHQSLDHVFRAKCNPLDREIQIYKAVSTKYGEDVDLSSTANYAVIN